MTKRRIRPPGEAHTHSHINPERYPVLRAFFGGYLHQDFVVEHGSPEAAARAFRGDAGDEDARNLTGEWQRFNEETRGWSLRALRRALTDLGAAWAPASRDELAALFDDRG